MAIKLQEHDHDDDCCNINIYCGGNKHHKCHCPIEFAEVYSSKAQTLGASPGINMPGQTVVMENTIMSTSGIDVTNAATTGQIIVKVAGWYDVTLGVTGSLNPIPSPLPCWTVSLFQNGALVPGSTFANLPLSPEQHANESVSDVFIHCNAGDVLTLANTSSATLFTTSPTVGTNAVVNSATFKIILLKED